MSKNKSDRPIAGKTRTAPPAAAKLAPAEVTQEDFRLPYPMILLAITVVVVYGSSIFFGLTDLDDTIFIRDFHAYNEQLGNLFTSFHRGLFDAVKDPYYRPLFLDAMVLNYQVSDHGLNIGSYHVVNVGFHILAVLLLYRLFRRLDVKELHAFILCLVFAVHPVLSQAVAWIPGRNDTMLAIFVFSFLLFAIDYSKEGKIRALLLSGLFLLLAFFTKETAVFAAPVAFVLLTLVAGKKWNEHNSLVQYGVWVGCFLIWVAARASATTQSNISIGQVAHDFAGRLPLILQYTGKVFLPFNLSVFPIQEDTVYYYGIAAVLLLIAVIYLNKEKNLMAVLGGLCVFLLFLLPVLFVPQKLNEQTFEHRLYLPMVGILLLLPQTILLHNRLKDKQLLMAATVVCGLLAAENFAHQRAFQDPISFWTSAAETSPHSAYANMMLAARLDKDEFARSCELFRKAYRLNPHEKYINFYMGEMLQKKDSVGESEKYLLAEKNNSGYYECDFYLARVAMERKDFNGAVNYLQTYLQKDPGNPMANDNLVLIYLDTHQPDQARAQVKKMQQQGLDVPKPFLQRLGM